MSASTSDFIESGLRTIRMEGEAIGALAHSINADFQRACELLLPCRGRIVVTGMGKSGHIANKIAATLASTGSPAFFVHPGEASHGDMGMITRDDAVLALSNSGNTHEILTIVPLLKRLHVPLVSMTGKPDSALARAADVNLHTGVEVEACPLGLAPTSSTTTALVMGDAIAIALLEARGFTAEDFAFSHPGGALGRKLLLKVADVMRSGDAIPTVSNTTSVRDALVEISRKGLGMTAVVNPQRQLLGVFTDGDLRRALDNGIDLHKTPIGQLMNTAPKQITADALAAVALNEMEDNKITALVVTDEHQMPCGVLHLHDLLRAGIA
ncbi:MAG TPA: KpsF/GutQ family sugar-phosphate isomerase [Pseudomonadales bacterium]|jgi:arabinose-5-phosphate isomerase